MLSEPDETELPPASDVITTVPSEPVDTVPPPASDVITTVPSEPVDTAALTLAEKDRAKAISNIFFILIPF